MTRPGVRAWLSGLRPRLVLAFAAMTVVGAAAAAGASYVSARTTILRAVQDPVMDQLRDQVTAYLPQLALPPDEAQLDALADNVNNGNATAVYGGLSSRPGFTPSLLTAELRREVAAGSGIQFQRVLDQNGEPFFVAGTVVLNSELPDTPGARLEVYTAVALDRRQDDIDQLATSAWRTTLLVLPVAAVLALLAARRVLRPVRALNTAARKLGGGQLDVRLPVEGSDELAQLVATFNGTAAELERTVESLRAMEADARRFVADVSHELRTPLAAMNTVTDVLDEDAEQLPEDTAVAARLVSSETRRLTRLVQDLVEVSRFDAGRAELRLDERDVATAVTDTLAARGWTGHEGLVLDLAPGVLATLDPRRLDVVVANLVGNALRHGRPPVYLALAADARTVTLTVTDHGPGIPEEVLPHVFDRFTKADTSRARSEGSGLGLAIARENARLHGGDLTAANTGSGARFTLTLPRERP
ncbi:HAMP domain-containing sensor histidine kinase [Amycolatopsis rhabdoformis]|uniref:histidine kinase n=1 Tax=Amycolatopsis rhabdoformis TaxID=1448059 RepID=A0ABZ1IKV0_9PSEU|nr:HAMP domain-containing sensor histidine kinase [Amycolatopsis rhabdoformis]WSE35116.1 HAMP domain-containing sensor histidine kinase [Amycolatopsis rhabdoformis]